MTKKPDETSTEYARVNAAIKQVCDKQMGLVDTGFLCQSLSVLDPPAPVCIESSKTVSDAANILKDNKVGCIVVVDDVGKVTGIFSERDYILKVAGKEKVVSNDTLSSFMTSDPMCANMDTTIAFALNLMSHGGFRHLPLVDDDNFPVGIISVKNVVDHIVGSFVDDLLNFEVA